jgi:hypothetical protein
MIPGELKSATFATIEQLKRNGVAESTTLEYKSELPGTSDDQRREFLKDVSAFANTAGGDLVYGVKEKDGVIDDIPGVEILSPDKTVLDLEQRIRDGIEPRLRPHPQFHYFEVNSGRFVLLIRADQSWIAPHRVSFKGHAHFYGRGAAGTYSMNVQQLRDAFTASVTLAERVRAFRMERVSSVIHGSTPVRIQDEGRPVLILHLIPLAAFASRSTINIAAESDRLRDFNPIGFERRAGTSRLNLDGRVNFAGHDRDRDPRWQSYTQIYRTGIVEAVEVLNCTERDGRRFVFPTYESDLREVLPIHLSLLNVLAVSTPIYCFVTLIRVGDSWLIYERSTSSRDSVDRGDVILPEVVIEDPVAPVDDILRPILDMIWNAVGHEKCPRYDANGTWRTW